MDQLELSVVGYPVQFETLTEVLEQQSDLTCRIRQMTWESAWDELAKISLYGSGPDVSQVGTTWLEGLVTTGHVRPFADDEVEFIGGKSVFLPAVWQALHLRWGGLERPWAIPWLADARIVFYWRDMLEQAGVGEERAFQTPQQVEETMERLRASDVEAPWGWWATTAATTLQCASSWIWQAGGDYISVDGRQILFDRPEALDGLLAYLKLHRYMPPGVERIGDTIPIREFAERRAAVAMGTPGWLPFIYQMSTIPDASDRLGVAEPPGPAFVGGSGLIVWRHARHVQDAIELVRFLTSKQVQLEHVPRMQHLPARLDVLTEPPYTTDVHYQVMAEALRAGRTFPVIPKWGAVEEKLMDALIWLWNSLLADPDQDMDALIKPYIENVARRLAITLGLRR